MQTYQLHILLKKPTRIQIGKLGIFDFPKGEYIYTGSAKKNIESRVNRHKSNSAHKKLHWHIDYLLNDKNANIIDIKMFKNEECRLNQQTEGVIVVNKFGAMDCKNGCNSHLLFIA